MIKGEKKSMVILIDVVKTSNIINHPLVRRKIFKQINFFLVLSYYVQLAN